MTQLLKNRMSSIWPFVNLGIGTSALEMELELKLELELILQTPLFPVPVGLWTPNLAGWWFRMRGPHPQSRVTLPYRGHATNKKRYISTFKRRMDPKFSKQGGNLGWRDVTYKVMWRINHVVTWQIENVIFPVTQRLWTPNLAGWWLRMRGHHLQNHVTHRSRGQVSIKTFYLYIHKAHGPQNLVGCWIRMRGPHPKSHVILQLCGHVKNQNRHISSTTEPSRCKRKACARQI